MKNILVKSACEKIFGHDCVASLIYQVVHENY